MVRVKRRDVEDGHCRPPLGELYGMTEEEVVTCVLILLARPVCLAPLCPASLCACDTQPACSLPRPPDPFRSRAQQHARILLTRETTL